MLFNIADIFFMVEFSASLMECWYFCVSSNVSQGSDIICLPTFNEQVFHREGFIFAMILYGLNNGTKMQIYVYIFENKFCQTMQGE